MKYAILILIMVSSVAQAEWLCTEASSTKIGNVITACGVGKSMNLEQARDSARDNAINEFNQLCKISADCNQYDYNVVPKRTDCQVHGGNVVCYRAIDFEITEYLKKDASINKDDLQKDLDETHKKLEVIQERLYKTRQLQVAKLETEMKERQLKQLEARDIKLSSISKEDQMSPASYSFFSPRSNNALKFGVQYWDAKLTNSSEADLALTIAYERNMASWLGVQIEFAHGGDMAASQNSPNTGTTNTQQTFQESMTYNTLSGSALIYTGVSKTYIKAEMGAVQANRTLDTVTYSSIGTGTSQKSNETILKAFSGVSLGYDSRDNNKGFGAYAELGARSTGGNVGAIASVGISIGF